MLVCCFLGTFAPSQACAAGSFWLRLEGKNDSTFACQGTESDTLIFRDGLVIRKSASQAGVITLTRMTAPADAMRILADSLAANRIGFAAGDCAVDAVQPNASFALTITWFGKPGRAHSILVNSPGGEPCPPATNTIFAAIERYLATASTAPGTEQVETSFDPEPPCGG